MTLAAMLFWLQEHYLNKLGRSRLGDATYQKSINALGFVVSDKKISSPFPHYITRGPMGPGWLT